MATEAKIVETAYIADLRVWAETAFEESENGKAYALKEVADDLERMPSVVHGRWVDRYARKYVNPVYDCSECKKSALFRRDMDLLGNWKMVQYLSDYCPYCGARMDGGRNG